MYEDIELARMYEDKQDKWTVPEYEDYAFNPTPPTEDASPPVLPAEPDSDATTQHTSPSAPPSPIHVAPQNTDVDNGAEPPPPTTPKRTSPVRRRAKKVPLALRRLQSFNTEGNVGIGEYNP